MRLTHGGRFNLIYGELNVCLTTLTIDYINLLSQQLQSSLLCSHLVGAVSCCPYYWDSGTDLLLTEALSIILCYYYINFTNYFFRSVLAPSCLILRSVSLKIMKIMNLLQY